MNLTKMVSGLRDILIILFISALGLVGICAVIDAGAYCVFGIRAPGEGADRFFEYHPRLGRMQRSGAFGLWHRYRDGTRYEVRINEHGFADRPRDISKGGLRIALLGDSTVQFWEAPAGERGHQRLQDLLGDRAEVMNFGVRGYGLDQSYVLYTDVVRRFRPDIVVLHICINDVWDHARQTDKPYFVLDSGAPQGIALSGIPVADTTGPEDRAGWRWFLWQYSYTLRRLGVIRHPDLKAEYPLAEHFELRPFKRNYNIEEERLLRLTARIIARFTAELRADGVRILVVEMPYRPVLTEQGRRQIRSRYGDQFDFQRWSNFLARVAAEQDLSIVSLPRIIQERGVDARTLFHAEDQLHVNALGSRLYAQAVKDKLAELGWLQTEPR